MTILDAAIDHAIKSLRQIAVGTRERAYKDFDGQMVLLLARKLEGIALDLEVSRDRDARGAQP